MQQGLEKTPAESRVFDIDCSLDLATDEVITSITGVTDESGELNFSGALVNVAPITYPGPRTVAAGKVIQVNIAGGTMPSGATRSKRTVHAVFATNKAAAVEAIVTLWLSVEPARGA